LPLTKVMVEMHQGRITIDSAVGIGTTVTVRLPSSRVRDAAARGRHTEY
jgi:signal transduction histidine kinase